MRTQKDRGFGYLKAIDYPQEEMNIAFTKESNKMIAEFMGLIKYNEQHDGMYCAETMELGDFPILFQDNQYNTSWDWLMDVVDEIEDMGCEVVITNGKCTISGANDYYGESIGKSRRGATYDAIVEFINQYNNNESTD